jgi:O-antigen/teichoic acid export membrane protein
VAQPRRSRPREAESVGPYTHRAKVSLFTRVRKYAAESVIRNSVFLIMNIGITAVCGYGSLSLITRMYSVEAVGLSAAALSAISLVVTITQSGINYSLPRLLPTSKNRDSMINTVHTAVLLATLAGSVIFLLTPFADKMYAIGGLLFALIFIVIACMQAGSSVLAVVLIADRESGKMTTANMVPNFIKVAAPPVFTALGNMGAYLARIIYNAFYYLILIFMTFRRGHRFKLELKREAGRELGRFSAGIYVATIIGGLPQMLLPVVVLARMGAAQSAYWGIAMTVGTMLYQLPFSITQGLLPEASIRPTERGRLILRSTLLVGIIIIPALIVTYIATPLLLGIFGHSYTAQVISPMHWLIYSGFVTMLNYTGGAILYLAKKSSAITILNIVDAIVVIGLASTWATNANGVAISWFIGDVGNTLLFAFFAFLALREVGFRLELLGGDEVQSVDTVGMPMPVSVQQAFDVLASIAEQQRLAAAEQRRLTAALYEPNRYNLTDPQGLYSVLALQDAELERQRQRQVQRHREQPEWHRIGSYDKDAKGSRGAHERRK